jgi:hypothetical protein
MKTLLQRLFIALAMLSTLNSQLSTLHAQGTAFTYQGRLNASGSPATGSYDLAFTLYTTNVTGSAIAGPVTNSATAVTNGLFTTFVDFGPGIFTGASNWLAIAVRTNATGSFTMLTPRQQVTPTPYALSAANATTAASANAVAAANVSGTLGLGQLPSAVVTNSATSVNLSGTFTGNGGGLTNLTAWQLAGNTGTTAANFLGTTDNQPLEIRVGGVRAGMISPSNGSPNIVFGPAQNAISNTTAGASILGGINNTIGTNSSYSVIGGGNQNGIQSGAGYSFLGSGLNNTIQTNATYSVLGGGQLNSIQSGTSQAVLGGGYQNSIQTGASQAFLGGGYLNSIQNGGSESFLGSGSDNSILSTASFIGSGYDNSIAGSSGDSVLGGGNVNSIGFGAGYSVLGGGQQNSISANADHSFIGGGSGNKVQYLGSVIVGGFGNNLGEAYSFIGGGEQNSMANGQMSALVGGFGNNIQNAYYAFLGGGLNNTNGANDAFLGGGSQNSISNNAAWSFLGGGQNNIVGGNSAVLGGGYLNSATALCATVPGGYDNVASGNYSFAAGYEARALHVGAFVWADLEGGLFASTNDNSFNVRANGGVRLVTSGAGLTVDGLPVLAGNNGSGLVNLNASQLTSGTVPLAQLPAALTQLPGIVVTNNEPFVSLGTLYASNLLTGGTLTLPLPAKISAYSTSILTVDANANTYFGLQAGSSGGSDNTAVGVNAFSGNGSGNKNVAVGESALGNSTNDNQLVAIGYQALENDNALGSGAPSGNGENTAVGYQALKANTVGAANTATGYKALYSSTNGLQNVAVGDYALVFSQGDQGNVAVGNNSLGNLGVVTGLITPGGGYNTAVGFLSLGQLVGGTGNIAIGQESGYNNYSGNNNIYIGNQGQNTDNGIIYIGTQGTQTATYLAGTVYANGVALTSDRNAKENFKPVDNQAVLAKVAALPLTQWNYRTDKSAVQHIGPMAQDFQAAFGLDGADDKHISVVDEGGVALAAIQGLNEKLNEKDAEIQTLKQSVDDLKKMVQSLAEKK